MSLATWKRDHYPIPVSRVSKKGALPHALRKFRGLTPAKLKCHGLTRTSFWIVGKGGVFFVDSETCALCRFWIDSGRLGCCAECPLAIVRGGVRCDLEMPGEELAPWNAFEEIGDPRPMISWLKKAIKAQERKP